MDQKLFDTMSSSVMKFYKETIGKGWNMKLKTSKDYLTTPALKRT